ncbi:hypothetical protein [Nonomuraea dietziae]|uniref:hypothetical protein n=1 Tax=Nonomuraea dietziae TaxID=65515 RepID=UPI0034189AD5
MSITLTDQDKLTVRTAAWGAVSLMSAAGAAGSTEALGRLTGCPPAQPRLVTGALSRPRLDGLASGPVGRLHTLGRLSNSSTCRLVTTSRRDGR